MQREWILTIDLYSHRSELLLEFNLLDRERRHRWKTAREVLPDVFQQMVNEIAAFFNYGLPPHERLERINSFVWLADRSFRLAEFLKGTDFSPPDALSINTLVTAIPWDLIPYYDTFLGHQISVGLKIPSARTSHPLSGSGEGRPRLLHVVADPNNDLPHAAAEVQQLKALVESVPSVDYELVVNPTRGDLIARFSRSTPFLHFTGHLSPRQGLVLKDDILKVEQIVRYFPGQRDQFVFLNGCDAVYEEQMPQATSGLDLFQSASVANAFLDAGAEAVIAPRSRIADEEAREAAVQIWKLIFESRELGEIIRLFRSNTSQSKPSAISGYSYVLYGEPSSRLRLSAPASVSAVGNVQTEEPTDLIATNEILLEAGRDADGPVAPRHIFACLTRRWILGQIFFSLDAQSYFLSLEELRIEVGVVNWLPPLSHPEKIEFTAAGSMVVNRALERRSNGRLDDLALLEGLALVNDAEVRCALEALKRGPRTIEAVLLEARDWDRDGRQIPHAVIAPDGYLNSVAFPAGLVGPKPANPTTSSVDRWDLFVELLHSRPEIRQLWTAVCKHLPPRGAWDKTQAPHWIQFTEPLRGAIADIAIMLTNDNAKTVSDGQLLTCLTDKDNFAWADLPVTAREWLSSQRIKGEKWESLLHYFQREALAWI